MSSSEVRSWKRQQPAACCNFRGHFEQFFFGIAELPQLPNLVEEICGEALSPWRLICSVGALGRAFYTNGSGGGFDMGMNKACDFQGAYVAFLELSKDPKFPRFGGAKITSSCLSALQSRIEIDLQ